MTDRRHSVRTPSDPIRSSQAAVGMQFEATKAKPEILFTCGFVLFNLSLSIGTMSQDLVDLSSLYKY
jgi:hypothetical protein